MSRSHLRQHALEMIVDQRAHSLKDHSSSTALTTFAFLRKHEVNSLRVLSVVRLAMAAICTLGIVMTASQTGRILQGIIIMFHILVALVTFLKVQHTRFPYRFGLLGTVVDSVTIVCLPAIFVYSAAPISPTLFLKNDIEIFVLGFAIANSFTLRPMQPVLIGCVGALSQIGYYYYVVNWYGPLQVTDSWTAVVETSAIHPGGLWFNGLILIPTICALLGVIVQRGRDNIVRAASLERDAATLELAAKSDPLTGLLNRRAVQEHLEYQIARHVRNRCAFAILLCDLDHFKQINDTYGHDMGDKVLRAVAQRLRDSLRELDLLARWGGEEFLALLPDTDLQGGAVVAEKIRKRLSEEPFQTENEELRLTLSIGVSTYAAGQSVEACIKAADGALYKAKHQGRNCVMVAEPVESM